MSMDSNRLRITGLASGINVDSMVQKLMTAEEIPLNKMKQQQQTMEWQRDDYRSMSSLLLDLKNSVFTLNLQSSFTAKTTTSTDDSALTATADGTQQNASYTISNATMATAAQNYSTVGIANSTSFDPNQSLFSADNAGLMTYGINWSTQAVSGETVSASADGSTFSLANGAIDSGSLQAGGTITVTDAGGTNKNYTIYTDQASFDAASGTNKVYVDHETGKLTFGESLTTGSSFSVNYSYKYVAFKMTTFDDSGTANTTSFQFNGSKSLNDIISSVNSSNAGVRMFYDQTTGKVGVTRSETGNFHGTTSDYEIGFNGSSFLTSTLDLHEANEQGGTDASFTFDGLQTTRHSNNFTLDGVTFNLKSDIPSGQSVTINSQTDVDTVFNEIKSFVGTYNDTIKQINDKLSEKKYRDYPPLTDAQKKSMSDTDIKLWSAKAQSGMLNNDMILPGGLDQMRVDIYSRVDSVSNSNYNQLAEIGITTSSDYRDHGKLVIDEGKLRAAIANDPQAVMQLFTASSSDYSQEGIAGRLENTIQTTIGQIQDKAGTSTMTDVQYYLGRNIDDLTTRIDSFQSHLNDVENSYYQEFTQMEQVISKANQQSGFLTSSFG